MQTVVVYTPTAPRNMLKLNRAGSGDFQEPDVSQINYKINYYPDMWLKNLVLFIVVRTEA